MSGNRLVLIDVFNYLHRAYHALPKSFKNKEGEPINAVYGFASMLISTIDTLKPTHIIAAWDDKDKDTFRAAKFVGYKAHRAETEEDLVSQIPRAEEVLEGFSIPKILVPGFEADDVIGTLAKQASQISDIRYPISVIVVSNDQDMLQLVSDKVQVFVPKRGKNEDQIFGPEEVEDKFGFKPKQLIDYKALRGDPSDNIPGVKGIGDKGAKLLVTRFGSVEKVYQDIDKVDSKSMRDKLIADPEIAVLSKDLATIRTDVPIELDLKTSQFKQLDKLKAIEVLEQFNFKSLVKRLSGDNKVTKKYSNKEIKKIAKGQEKLI